MEKLGKKNCKRFGTSLLFYLIILWLYCASYWTSCVAFAYLLRVLYFAQLKRSSNQYVSSAIMNPQNRHHSEETLALRHLQHKSHFECDKPTDRYIYMSLSVMKFVFQRIIRILTLLYEIIKKNSIHWEINKKISIHFNTHSLLNHNFL